MTDHHPEVPRRATPVSRPQGPRSPGIPSPSLIDRAVGVVRGIARAVIRLASVALVAGIIIWWAVLRRAEDAGPAGLTILAVLLLAPPAILFLFALALRALAALPRRLRETPGAVGDRLAEIRRRVAEVGEARRRGLVASVRSLFRLGWSVTTSREVLELSPALVLLTPGMLVASLACAGLALLEVLGGGIAALVLLLS